MKLHEYYKEIKTRQDRVNEIFNEADAKQDGICNDDQIAEIKRLNHETEEFSQDAQKLEQQDELRKSNQKALYDLNEIRRPEFPDGSDRRGLSGKDEPGMKGISGIADAFVKDEAFNSYIKSIAPGGKIHEKVRIQSPAVNFNAGLKTLLTGASDTSAGAMVFSERQGLLEPGIFMRPLRIRDLISIGETGSDTVEYVRITGVTNNAAPVGEATATSGSSGTKPESALATEVVTERVRTIATWMPATRRALMDAPQLRGLVDDVLRYMLSEELEDQVIAGDGTGENFTGILNTSGTQSQAFATDMLTTARKARTLVVTPGRSTPTAWVLNPLDWEAFDLTQDAEERYYFGGPVGVGIPRLWGVPVIESEAMPQGTAVIGEWRWARIWDRMQTAIYVSDSHSDFFVRNLIAILAELMAAFGVIRPKAFVEVAWS